MSYIEFNYPLHFYLVYVIFSFLVSIEMLYFGYLFYFVSKKHEIPRLKILSMGFLALGASLFVRNIGNIYFAVYGSAETPVSMLGCTINFLPVCTAVLVFTTFLWYISLYIYARLQRNNILVRVDYPAIGFGILGSILALLPQNMWLRTDIPRLQKPTPWNPNPTIHIESIIRLMTSILLIAISFLTVLSYYLLYRSKIRGADVDAVTVHRHEYMLLGILLMVFAVVPITIRDVAAVSGEEIVAPALISLVLSSFFQFFSAFFLYTGILAPDWIVRRWTRK